MKGCSSTSGVFCTKQLMRRADHELRNLSRHCDWGVPDRHERSNPEMEGKEMIQWNKMSRSRRDEKQRMVRLRTKAQKAGVIDRIEEIVKSDHTWNRRFGRVAYLRSMKEH